MAERGVFVDHATVHRWALKIVPALVKVFRCRARPVGKSWRMDETYIKVRGRWKYLHRAVDRHGDTVDFLLTSRRDEAAARRFLERAIDRNGEPEKMDLSGVAPECLTCQVGAPSSTVQTGGELVGSGSRMKCLCCGAATVS